MAKVLMTLILIVALVLAPSQAWAGGCGYYSYAYPIVQQVIQPVYQPFAVYQVGQDLEIKAAVEKALRIREEAEFQQKQAYVQQYQQQQWSAQRPAPYAPPQQQGYAHQQQAPPQQPTAQPPLAGGGPQLPTLMKHCGSCHATENSSAGYKWSLNRPQTAEQGMLIVDWVANPQSPKVPPPPQMSGVLNGIPAQEKGAILNELLSIPRVTEGGDLAQTAPPPPKPARSSFGGF